MAVETVDALSELASPATNDEVGIWDVSAGQFKKIQVSNLFGGVITGGGTIATGGYTMTVPATGTAALLGTANVFTANQRVPRLEVDGANAYIDTGTGTDILPIQIRGAPVSVANDAAVTIPSIGLIFIIIDALATYGLFATRAGYNAVTELLDSTSTFTTTKDNAGTWNVYTTAGVYYLQNKTGSARDVQIVRIGG